MSQVCQTNQYYAASLETVEIEASKYFEAWIKTTYCTCFYIGFKSNCPEVFCKKDVLKISVKFTGKYLCRSLFCNKDARLRPANLLKRKFWCRCFPVNFTKILRTSFL